MHKVTLTASELMLCAHVAGLIRGVKRVQHAAGHLSNRRIADLDDFELHYLGMCGEAAVSRVLGVPVRSDITTFGDGLVDLQLSGQSIQIKTSSHASLRQERLAFVNSMDEFKAEWLVVCSMQGAATVGIHGFISRQKFEARSFEHDFGYGSRVCVKEDVLAPIEKMAAALVQRQAA